MDGGLNTYGYVSGDPVSLIDPFGLADSSTPWSLGWEWLSGTGPRHHHFTDGDPFTEMLRKHSNIQALLKKACNKSIKPQGKANYYVGGVDGVWKYFQDYSNLLTMGHTGNLAVTFLGSYNATYTINGNILSVHAWNNSTIQSATHPPIIGYTQWWEKHIGDPLDKRFKSGPMSKTTQTIDMTFDLSKDCSCGK